MKKIIILFLLLTFFKGNTQCPAPSNLAYSTVNVQDVVLRAGAEFIVVLTGKIMTMPGLPKIPSAENIDLDENGNILGIF